MTDSHSPLNEAIPAWIDGQLVPVGKLDAHLRGLRHKAVSVFVMSGDGRLLVQRRAAGKYHTPGLWANSCCTHPHWGEAAEPCAARRLGEELGLYGLRLLHRGQVEYRADVGGGMIEHELVDMFLAEAGPEVRPVPNPAEVMETDWLSPDDLAARIAQAPARFTPWLRLYMAQHRDLIFGG